MPPKDLTTAKAECYHIADLLFALEAVYPYANDKDKANIQRLMGEWQWQSKRWLFTSHPADT